MVGWVILRLLELNDYSTAIILGFIIPDTKHMRPKRMHETFDSEIPAVFGQNVELWD